MDWTAQVDVYCERTDPGYWSEPVNALSNLAFLVVAVLLWRRTAGLPLGRALSAILFAIGVGSWLWHTHATAWSGLTDVLPIALFILTYIYAANRAYLGWPAWAAGLGAAGFIPYAAALIPVFSVLPFFGISASYWPVPLLIAIYAVILRRRLPEVARGLALGAGLLVVSLTARSLDEAVCAALPLGTHFLWHIFNAVMLGWMIEVWRRHMVARGPAER